MSIQRENLWLLLSFFPLFMFAGGHLTYRLPTLISFELVLKFCICLLLHIELKNLALIDFLMDELLSVFARQLVFGDVGKLLMHDHCLLPLSVKDRSAFCYLSKASHYRGMNKPD